jgi:hypothetical protein
MRSLRERWQRFWFDAEGPENLAICRALFFGIMLLLYVDVSWSQWSEVSRVFWEPITLFKRLHVPVFGAPTLTFLGALWKVALLLSALGLFTRWSTAIAFVVGLYLLGLPHNFGKTHHFDALVVLVMGVLMLARCGDAHSLDRLLVNRGRGRGRGQESGQSPAPSGEYRWPVRATWLLMSLVFCSAGIAKLRHGGLAWVFSDNMATVLLQHGYNLATHEPLSRIGLWLAQFPKLCSAMALLTVIIEAGYPLALVSRRARWIFPPGMCALLIGIRFTMGPVFPQFVICHLFWVPWPRVLAYVSKRRQEPATVTSPPAS